MEEEVSQFAAITGQPEHVARGYVEISGGDAMQAIQLFYESPELASSFNASGASSSAARPDRSATRRNTAGREDASGVIHIDSDDDMAMDDDEDDIGNLSDGGVGEAVRNAQEDEDAAMARRLQEEMYGQNSGAAGGESDVRAPIAQRTEMLAAPDPLWAPMDDEVETPSSRLRRTGPRTGPRNPFSQSIWEDEGTTPRNNSAQQSTRAQRLTDLFAPPHDLMFNKYDPEAMRVLSWEDAREVGREMSSANQDEKSDSKGKDAADDEDQGKDNEKEPAKDGKWLLVNLQNMNDFQCQALNRDHWKDESLRKLIKAKFLFLQYDKDNFEENGQEYITFYMPNHAHENPDNYPHLAIVDPRTGERVKVWSGSPFPSPSELHAELEDFAKRYSLRENNKNPVAKSKPKQKTVDYGRMTEDEMLEMALQNSLQGTAGASGSNVHDPDALTKSQTTDGQPETQTGDEPSASAAESEFAKISSTNPHTEPANDPASTTRIQFRHAKGRVIRRFAVSDTVRVIYEWLKADPLEGKQGVPFELKAMPAGRDLIDELEKTIEGAGLKQGTVMIEYIED